MHPLKDMKAPWNCVEQADCWPQYPCGAPSGPVDGGPGGFSLISLLRLV